MGSIEKSCIGLTRENIEEMIETSIGVERKRVENFIEVYIVNKEITSIDNVGVRAIEELRTELSTISKLTRNLQAEIAKLKKAKSEDSKSPIPAPGELSQTAISNTMTWVKFHRLVGLAPPSNKEKTKPNAELALAKAIEMGVTGWQFDSTNKEFRHSTPNPP